MLLYLHVIHALIHWSCPITENQARLCVRSQNEFVTNGHHQGFYSRINYLPYGTSTWLTSQGIEKMLGIPKKTDGP